MRLAIIDLGTNSVRFGVHELLHSRSPAELYREKLMIRLGQNVFANGKLDASAIRRTVSVFQAFQRKAADFNVTRMVAFGTSALRDAKDATRLLDLLKKKSGIDVRVISGDEEARLIALGVLSREKIPKGRYALIDIGGGSTEVTLCSGKKVLLSRSFPLGTARLQQLFLNQSPPGRRQLEELRRFVRTTLEQDLEFKEVLGSRPIPLAIGSSGTIRAISRLLRKNLGAAAIAENELSTLIEIITPMTRAQLAKVNGMEPKRTDMILAGAVLLEEALLFLRAKKAVPTQYSLRDGILSEESELYRQKKASHLSLHLRELQEIAFRFGVSHDESRSWVEFASQLFEALRVAHKLPPQWKIYLLAATLFKNTGRLISPAGLALHSHYIARNVDFPATETWEQELIAWLCLHHQTNSLPKKKSQFRAGSKSYNKLLALLSLVDAFDHRQPRAPTLKKCRTTSKTVTLWLSKRSASGLEPITLAKRDRLYRSTLKRRIEVKFI